ncbi:hypothetical protein AVEN_31286-1 [Araneus ventricosus]|uniref:Uncharacterized protein n=1 Tax=Araneus ventricosus TaxID=182803 RepID=A0A4Y2T1Y9_ARAVE|nr:hypothetical protein AVEN_31286-1 [Araneus ventricosus]
MSDRTKHLAADSIRFAPLRIRKHDLAEEISSPVDAVRGFEPPLGWSCHQASPTASRPGWSPTSCAYPPSSLASPTRLLNFCGLSEHLIVSAIY